MIHNIRDAFYDLLKEADWMDQPTQLVAREKVRQFVLERNWTSVSMRTKLEIFFPNMDFLLLVFNLVTCVSEHMKKKESRQPVS